MKEGRKQEERNFFCHKCSLHFERFLALLSTFCFSMSATVSAAACVIQTLVHALTENIYRPRTVGLNRVPRGHFFCCHKNIFFLFFRDILILNLKK